MLSGIAYLLARLVIAVFRALPRPAGVAILRFLAAGFYCLSSRHRHIADVNLQIAFPELSPGARRRIARRSFQNTAMNLLEVSKCADLTPENISGLVDYDRDNGLNNYRLALEKGKGILYLTGHFSSWELLPTAHALHGYPLSFITRPLDNARLDRYLHAIRESKGNRVFGKKNSVRHILQSLKSVGAAGILMDQNTSLQEGMFIDFFGIPAATSTGMALLALRTGAPVLPGYLSPMRNGRYTIKFLPPVDVVRTGDRDGDLQANTRRFNEILEQIIREQPESWLWGHKRWKYQPEGNPQDLYSLTPAELASFLKDRRSPRV
ncbi:MAG: lysophospholipid acyltransferase family protein [Acidobacteriota bacterium]|nr:lysophospholipid acyltransferase family protein [Acidobacteriota bacterium]